MTQSSNLTLGSSAKSAFGGELVKPRRGDLDLPGKILGRNFKAKKKYRIQAYPVFLTDKKFNMESPYLHVRKVLRHKYYSGCGCNPKHDCTMLPVHEAKKYFHKKRQTRDYINDHNDQNVRLSFWSTQTPKETDDEESDLSDDKEEDVPAWDEEEHEFVVIFVDLQKNTKAQLLQNSIRQDV